MNTTDLASQGTIKKFDKVKLTYLGSTVLLSLMMMMSAGMYFFNHAEVQKVFTALGFPAYIIYPLAIAKILGLVAIWTRKSPLLLNLAYAGFFYNFVLAFSAHVAAADGEFAGALMAMVLLAVSYFTQKEYFTKSE